jgi:hypothetical protein
VSNYGTPFSSYLKIELHANGSAGDPAQVYSDRVHLVSLEHSLLLFDVWSVAPLFSSTFKLMLLF